MIEIFMLIMLSRRNGRRAKEKGYPSGTYTFITIIVYLFGELIGAILAGSLDIQTLRMRYFITFLGGITGGVAASIYVINLKPKHLIKPTQEAPFYPEDPDALWECPSCSNQNANTTFDCIHCGYKLR